MNYKCFTFNPFAENTYVLSDESGECIIIDPGCINANEERELYRYIEANKLKPVMIINTHAHLDHVCGNAAVSFNFKIPIAIHPVDLPLLRISPTIGSSYGIPIPASPEPTIMLDESNPVTFGNTNLKVLFTPGHCPGEVCLFNVEARILIAGDVLFNGSIGRTDLPGGDMKVLECSIREKLYTLPDDVLVLSGHGPETTIGTEKRTNPFVRP